MVQCICYVVVFSGHCKLEAVLYPVICKLLYIDLLSCFDWYFFFCIFFIIFFVVFFFYFFLMR